LASDVGEIRSTVSPRENASGPFHAKAYRRAWVVRVVGLEPTRLTAHRHLAGNRQHEQATQGPAMRQFPTFAPRPKQDIQPTVAGTN
jgi:hypothetical protein